MLSPSRREKRRVCIVTAEFHGLFKNGGIGTANTGLALSLAEAGHEVVVAYVDAGLVDFDERVAEAADTIAAWAQKGVKLEFVPRNPMLRAGHEDHVAASFTVFQYLRGRGFALVFFNECGGQGYFSLLAKRAGLFPDAPRMVVVTHGANAWVLELNEQLYWSLHPISVDFLERRSVELADDLVSPSRYLVGWMGEKGWRLPASTRIIQNALPLKPNATQREAAIDEIVFFGRLEARKGVELFLSAYTALCAKRDMSRIKVTFLGKFSRIEGVHSGVYVLERTRTWPAPPSLIAELSQEQALSYLSRPGVLAIMPSRAENSPCVVVECIVGAVPFIATDSGGTAELIAEADRARCLCAGAPEALVAAMDAALDDGAPTAQLAVSQEQSRELWLDLVDETSAASASAPMAKRNVSLCLAPGAAGNPTSDAWAAFLAQDFAEIIVVSAKAWTPPTNDPRVRLIVEPAAGVAKARNLAASRARGPWLMFADEGEVILKGEALAGFLTAAAGLGADVVTSPALEFTHAGPPRDGWDGFLGLIPTGANLTLAAFENCLGEGCFLIDRARFLTAGGFDAEVGAGLRDRLLLTEAALSGGTLEVAPTPLFWRRSGDARTLAFDESSSDQRRMLRAFARAEARLVAPALETVVASGPRNRERVTTALTGLGSVAHDLALRLSFMSMRDSEEQHRPFIDYCLARGRFQEGFAFASWLDDPELLALARGGAEAAAEKAALGALREPQPEHVHSISLSRFAADRARALETIGEADLRREDGIVASFPLRGGVAVVKAASLCPPAARRLQATVEAGEGVRVALAACEKFAQVELKGETLASEQRFYWSGWRAPGDIALDISAPFGETADVFLLARGEGERLTWNSLSADVPLFDLTTPSAVSVEPGATPLPRRALAGAECLTPAQDFPGPYFQPGPPSQHHPLVGRPALVRLKRAVFAGATGLRATFSIENEQSRPVAFALWARHTGPAVREVEGLEDSEGFSGWVPVHAAFRKHTAAISFPEPLRQAYDLYLATRVVDFPDNNYCHAVWHDIFVIEKTRDAG